jgi:16S rRNA (adenine1518-N6/adenine1519-N6)-dimethyltransferase
MHMSLLQRTKSVLRSHRSLPKRSFGQNFIIEQSVYERMISHASLDKNDTVLDIGAGLGFLSRLMAEKCKNVLAVEADAQMVEILREQVGPLHNVKIIEGDVFKAKLSPFNKIVSAPPYNISSRLIQWILDQKFDCALFVFQREFADRLVASVGSEEYGWLTVYAYGYGEVELLEEVTKTMFYPQPKVDSIVTRIVLKEQEPRETNGIEYRKFLQNLFTQRNRKVKGAVLSYLRDVRKLTKPVAVRLVENLPYSERRVRELAPEDFGVLANVLNP